MKGSYKVVKNFITPEKAKSISDLIINSPKTDRGDGQVDKSWCFSNFPACNILLGEMLPEVSRATGKKLVPTYSYARIYLKGADLKPHKDRPSCEYSVTVNLSQTHPWPVFMGKKSIIQKPGDGVVYKGCEIEHSRKEFDGDEYVQVFLHYVDSEGPHKDNLYDKHVQPTTNKVHTYRLLFPDCSENQINYYWFGNSIPDDLFTNLRKNLDTKYLEEARVGNGSGSLDNSKRRSKVYWLPKTDEFIEIYKIFFELVAKCNMEFYQFRLSEIAEHIQYTVYESQNEGFYDWHVDMGPGKARRKLSLVCQLSDPSEYEGGDLQINTGNIETVKKEKGMIVIFPSYLLHRVTPVTKGTRRSLVLWIEGPPFN